MSGGAPGRGRRTGPTGTRATVLVGMALLAASVPAAHLDGLDAATPTPPARIPSPGPGPTGDQPVGSASATSLPRADTTADSARLRASEQHLVVVVEEPDATRGVLHRIREDGEGWERIGDPVSVVVGRSGVGPKREGDGRSPRGVFPLGPAFGYAATPPDSLDWPYPYRPMGPGTVCVDDPASEHYNRIVRPDRVAARDWSSAEAMRRDRAHDDDLYEWGVWVRYNSDREPGAGSCIFLHVWRGPTSPTAGCTAMPRPALLELLGWLRPAADPILVQGTRSYLRRLHARGVLPYPPPPG